MRIGPSGLRALSRNEVPTINGVFSHSLSLSAPVTFLPEEVIVGFQNFAQGLKAQKKKIRVKKKYWGPPVPQGVDLLGFLKQTKSA